MESFYKVVGHVDHTVYMLKVHKIAVDLLAQGEVFNVHMPRAWGWLLGIAHGCAGIVVFIENSGYLLWDVEIPYNITDIENHFAGVIGGYKFSLSG